MTLQEIAPAPCPLCPDPHDEIVNFIFTDEIKHMADGEVASELGYVRRELVDEPLEERVPLLRHRLLMLEIEDKRRRQLAAKGGPLYRGRGSIDRDVIDAAKTNINIADLIGRDLPIAWARGERTRFHCDAHGSGKDSDPSLLAYEDQGRWRCYGCNSGGDAIDWLIVRHGLSFRQAVEALT